MNMVKCANGHFYDAEKNSFCPYCSAPNGQIGGDPDDQKTESFETQSMRGYYPNAAPAPSSGIPVTSAEQPYMPQQPARTAPSYSVKPTVTTQEDMWVDDDPKTEAAIYMGPRSSGPERARNTSYTPEMDRTETSVRPVRPVVGWLVCISGVNYGLCYNLYSGKNFVGRDMSNDICLGGDQSISRSKHAVIIYEPTRREFFVTLGDDSHELVYQNGNVVLTSRQLADRDVLKLGRTELVFVPFCDERNGWGVGEPEE